MIKVKMGRQTSPLANARLIRIESKEGQILLYLYSYYSILQTLPPVISIRTLSSQKNGLRPLQAEFELRCLHLSFLCMSMCLLCALMWTMGAHIQLSSLFIALSEKGDVSVLKPRFRFPREPIWRSVQTKFNYSYDIQFMNYGTIKVVIIG